MSRPETSTLLSIPLELRFQIYDLLIPEPHPDTYGAIMQIDIPSDGLLTYPQHIMAAELDHPTASLLPPNTPRSLRRVVSPRHAR